MRRRTVARIGIPVVATLAGLAATFRFVPLAIAAVIALVILLVYWWRKPNLPRNALSIAKVKREVAPKRANQTILDSILG
jgi:hypothetical protein